MNNTALSGNTLTYQGNPPGIAAELRKLADMLDRGVAIDIAIFAGQGGNCSYQMNPINQPWPMIISMIDCALSLREATKKVQGGGLIQLLR